MFLPYGERQSFTPIQQAKLSVCRI
jgi:hypothetical protein